MIVLDTDVVSLLRHPDSPTATRISRLLHEAAASNEQVATTIVNYEEHMRGWMSIVNSARTMQELIHAYTRLASLVEDYRRIEVLRFTELAATHLQRLQKQKLRLGTMDLRIAAIALAHDATLFTRNLRDFSKIPGLKVQDPLA